MQAIILGVTWVVWLVVGLVWLWPQLQSLRQRHEGFDHAMLKKLAADGDTEATRYLRLGRRWGAAGFVAILPQVLLISVSRLH
jgi:hypothetical protein